MKRIFSFVLIFVIVFGLCACGSEERAPHTSSTEPPTVQLPIDYSVVNACAALIKETYGDRATTSVENGQFIITILEPFLTTEAVYGTYGLAEGYDSLSAACHEATELDTLVGVRNNTGEIVYASFNGVDITGYAI